MIVLIKDGAKEEQVRQLIERLESFGFQVHVSKGVVKTILGLVGNTARLDIDLIRSMEIVQDVKRVQEPYKNANRKFHPEDTVITVGGVTIGGGKPVLIAGPCSVESEDQILQVARAVKRSGAGMLRGGAFKPRTSPYSFQGLGAEGIRLLLLAKEETGLPIVTEIMDQGQLPFFDGVDVFQVGARNMQNYELLRVLGTLRKPVLLKRGFSNTLEELLMSAEYIMAGGNEQVILCERGIRTFETSTRFTLDISAVGVVKRNSHLPVLVDPSHAAGHYELVPVLARAAVAAGADGLLIEVHPDPVNALSDGLQQLTFSDFGRLMGQLRAIAGAVGRSI